VGAIRSVFRTCSFFLPTTDLFVSIILQNFLLVLQDFLVDKAWLNQPFIVQNLTTSHIKTMAHTKDLNEMLSILQAYLLKYVPPLMVKKDTGDVFEVTGSIPVMQGKKMVDGYYFASIIPKPKDIRLYYFPIYTHAKKFDWISDELRKCLKGKSCFHFKQLTDTLHDEIDKMIGLGVDLYSSDRLI
jgi:hypothetical protein